MAEGEGFEPPVTEYATTVFKTAALNRSATPPQRPLPSVSASVSLEYVMITRLSTVFREKTA